jgi:hypothetical protein
MKNLWRSLSYCWNFNNATEKTQDANIEFVSILQELEETIESQRIKISVFFSHMSNVIDHEVSKNAEWERKLSP